MSASAAMVYDDEAQPQLVVMTTMAVEQGGHVMDSRKRMAE